MGPRWRLQGIPGRAACRAGIHVFGAKHSGWRPFHLPAPNKQLSPDADLRSVSSCSTARALHYNARYRLSAASVPLGPSISTATSLGWPAPSLLGRTSRGKGETLTPRPSNQISPSDLWRLLHNSKDPGRRCGVGCSRRHQPQSGAESNRKAQNCCFEALHRYTTSSVNRGVYRPKDTRNPQGKPGLLNQVKRWLPSLHAAVCAASSDNT